MYSENFFFEKTYDFKFNLHGQVFNLKKNMPDIINIFMDYSWRILFENQTFVNWTDSVNTYNSQFFFVLDNCYSSVLDANLFIEEQTLKVYNGKVDEYLVNFEISFIFYLTLCIILILMLIPILTNVKRISGEVMSLFGYIKTGEINEIIDRASKFNHDYLKNEEVQKNDRKDSYSVKRFMDSSSSMSLSSGRSGFGKIVKVFEEPSESQLLNEDPVKNSLNNQEIEDEEEEKQEIRKENLKKTKLKETLSFFPTIVILISLLLIFSIVDFVLLNKDYLQQQKVFFGRILLYNQRPDTLFTSFGRSMEKGFSKLSILNADYKYLDKMYDIEREVFEGVTIYSKYPKFSAFQREFDLLSFGDICENYFKISNPGMYDGFLSVISGCKATNNGILAKGLRTAIISLLEEFRIYSIQFNKENVSKQEIISFLNSPRAETMSSFKFYYRKYYELHHSSFTTSIKAFFE